MVLEETTSRDLNAGDVLLVEWVLEQDHISHTLNLPYNAFPALMKKAEGVVLDSDVAKLRGDALVSEQSVAERLHLLWSWVLRGHGGALLSC